jgi:hypothetical protein
VKIFLKCLFAFSHSYSDSGFPLLSTKEDATMRRFQLSSMLMAIIVVQPMSQHSIALAQTAQSVDSSLLTQTLAAFSGGQAIQNIQLSATAVRYMGDAQDSGDAILTATPTAANSVQLSLAAEGSWDETQSDFGAHAACQWSGNDGIAHDGDYLNCFRPIVWFMPLLSLQASSTSAGIGTIDLGTDQVGSGTYRHLQCQATLSQLPADLLASSVQASTTDIWIDPGSTLPAILQYHVHPDGGGLTDILIEIHYADYRNVNGVMIPFTIQRYINGSLQLEIQVSSAQIS